MLPALVLAAGLGTRLRPLTESTPKAGVPIGDRPALLHVVAGLRGCSPVVVNAFHHADAVLALAARAGAVGVREASLLGTAGGLRNAAGALGPGPVLVWNADIQSRLAASSVIEAHAGAPSALATLAVALRPEGAIGEGTVGVDRAGRVARLRGEVFGEEVRGADFVGVHVIGAPLREGLPEVGCLVGDVYLPALRAGGALATYATDAPFVDVGTLASYLAANLAWLDARALERFCAPSARVSAEVRRSVVGEGAQVDAPLDECVVWPGAHVTERQRRAVITKTHVIEVDSPGAKRGT